LILNLFSAKTAIGLDIQSDAVRLIKFNKHKQHIFTELMLEMPLPDNVVNAGKIIDWQRLMATLAEFTRKHHLQGINVAVQIPASLLRMRILYLPKGLSANALHEDILREINKDLSGIQEPLAFDYVVFNELYSDYQIVIYAVIRKSYLDQYIACVNATGMKLKIIDIDIYALVRLAYSFIEYNDSSSHAPVYACFVQEEKTYLIAFHPSHVLQHDSWTHGDKVELLQQLQLKLQNLLCTVNDDNGRLIIFAMKEIRTSLIKLADNLNIPCTFISEIAQAKYLQKHAIDFRGIPSRFYIAGSLGLRGLHA
jgi:Tfp pilus assembly PilM family ATPase